MFLVPCLHHAGHWQVGCIAYMPFNHTDSSASVQHVGTGPLGRLKHACIVEAKQCR
jgi:hypothetical protein